MKMKMFKIVCLVLLSVFLLSSCFTYKTAVGDGPMGEEKVKQWNHYLLWGLVPIGVSDNKEMAGGAADYEVKTQTTFLNGLISGLTAGIYASTTTTVTK